MRQKVNAHQHLFLFGRIEGYLYKYPAVDEKLFRAEVEQVVNDAQKPE